MLQAEICFIVTVIHVILRNGLSAEHENHPVTVTLYCDRLVWVLIRHGIFVFQYPMHFSRRYKFSSSRLSNRSSGTRKFLFEKAHQPFYQAFLVTLSHITEHRGKRIMRSHCLVLVGCHSIRADPVLYGDLRIVEGKTVVSPQSICMDSPGRMPAERSSFLSAFFVLPLPPAPQIRSPYTLFPRTAA